MNARDFRTQVGLHKPEKPFDEGRDIEAMRAEIERSCADSAVIYQCFEGARICGITGEGKYILLAFHALRALEDTTQLLARALARNVTEQQLEDWSLPKQ